MLDLNDLRVFERVAALRGFTAAARALGLPKSSVSRSIARLEGELGTRLLQRSTREVALTEVGEMLRQRCADLLGRVAEMTDYVGGLGGTPRGPLRVSAGIGFGVNVLSELVPEFLERYPQVEVHVDLTSRIAELIADNIDVAIRMGPLPDSRLVATKLGVIRRYLCAAPAYLDRRGVPQGLEDLRAHDTVEMPSADGRPRPWAFSDPSGRTVTVETKPRLCVNDALTIHRAVAKGAGLGCLSGYLCAPDIAAGRLVRLMPEWRPQPVEVHAVFPSNRELSATVRAFVDFLKQSSAPGRSWQDDPLVA
ncbi:LysR family transcriptional regulator [Arenibaculum pallidiluteum]|uniref:LysR family transcriptional regulator n=1 Tax=Arenibaculum pallidiluteum TaxID=2812559 RepID=UPI001A95D1F5|nr:LysR family transcriptional regulator [Arenibaculum pallidiluteum]